MKKSQNKKIKKIQNKKNTTQIIREEHESM